LEILGRRRRAPWRTEGWGKGPGGEGGKGGGGGVKGGEGKADSERMRCGGERKGVQRVEREAEDRIGNTVSTKHEG